VIFYSSCNGAACAAPELASTAPPLACAAEAGAGKAPAIALNAANSLLLVWETENGVLPFLNWTADGSPQTAVGGCIPVAGLTAGRQPRISEAANDLFGLVFTAGLDADSRVYHLHYNGGWSEREELGNGRYPEIYVDNSSQTHVVWCGQDGLNYWHGALGSQPLRTPCFNRPQIGMDGNGRLHVIWYSDVVISVLGRTNTDSILYEITQFEGDWTNSTIIDRIGSQIQPAVVVDDQGTLHMVRTQGSELGESMQYQAQVQYSCEGYELTRLAQILYDVTRLEIYRDPDTIVPYCQNRYDNLVFTPNADPAFSDLEPLVNGAYDQMAQVADTAEYEVLLTTMWYDADVAGESPGVVIASTIADLYNKVKANPEAFPRGLTVRILLGNPPEFATGDFTGQLWSVLEDIRNAGVPEMTNPDIGWNLQVANYKGALPHSHTKMLVVDGKTVVAAGYNMTYEHFSLFHPSGRGGGRNDLGIQVTGPVAQDAVLAFDDLWVGSDQRHCTDFYPPYGVWQASCFDFKALGRHVPEVMKYYIPAGGSTAFSMFRSNVRDESDRQIADALAAAETSIDTMQVNFTMEMICDLNILYDVCTFQEALPYMEGLVAAAENGAQVRILIKGAPADGIESAVAVNILKDEISKRGLQDNFELRYFDGPMHYKSINIDGELVIVGSQNFHYSALDPLSGLAEYNLGVVDEQAVADYEQLFEYHWQKGTLWE
jgi:phosphatidylserine/phosphatidylglycerophosphate/cardiolipin synthase-like enzyme